MAKSMLRKIALRFRKQGMSYSQIKGQLGVSKSTLSLWLREYPLSELRIRQLTSGNLKKVERFRETMRLKRESRRKRVYVRQKASLVPLSKHELCIAGLMLYWGEGSKTNHAQLSLSNTDVTMLQFYIRWLVGCLGLSRDKIKVKVHLYKDMEISKEMVYWQKSLRLKGYNFKKPYIKRSTVGRITNTTRGHGTCNVIVYGRDYFEQVMMGIQAISGEFVGLG